MNSLLYFDVWLRDRAGAVLTFHVESILQPVKMIKSSPLLTHTEK